VIPITPVLLAWKGSVLTGEQLGLSVPLAAEPPPPSPFSITLRLPSGATVCRLRNGVF
jgi:hypothetical protein